MTPRKHRIYAEECLPSGKRLPNITSFFLIAGVLSDSRKDDAFISPLSATLYTKTDVLSVPVQLEYNYIWNPSDTVSFYTGIRGGFAYNNCDVDISPGRLSHSKAEKFFDSMLGAGLSVRVRLAEHCRPTAGYEFLAYVDGQSGAQVSGPSHLQPQSQFPRD